MSTNGSELLIAIRQVRHFFREVAGLLATTDGMMSESGWDRRAANTAISDASYSLQVPERWMPYMAFRYYQMKQAPTLLPSVSVVLDGEAEDAGLILEPLVVATLFDFGPGISVSSSYYNYNHAGLYARLTDRRDDGSVTAIDPRVVFPTAKCVAQRMVAFAIPLVQVDSSSALRDKVVMPLLALIDQELTSAEATEG